MRNAFEKVLMKCGADPCCVLSVVDTEQVRKMRECAKVGCFGFRVGPVEASWYRNLLKNKNRRPLPVCPIGKGAN